MASATCFVIMPIGDQEYVGGKISAAELKRRYDDLIKEAILAASPNLEVVRADDVALPGTITSDILTRLMHSDYVVADVTYPNPIVFYELGLRHACRTGTVLIRDRAGPKTPFDIAHLRHIEYENTPSGLKALAEQLATYFDHAKRNPNYPDNQLQELAKLTSYSFPSYSAAEKDDDAQLEVMMAVMQSPDLMQMLLRKQQGENVDQAQILQALAAHPKIAEPMFKALLKSGEISPFGQQKKEPFRNPVPRAASAKGKKKKGSRR
jgi:hypothetical protein